MAEGSCFYMHQRRTSPVVSIRQTRTDNDLAEVIDALPWRVRGDGDGGYRIYSKQLHDHLKVLGDTYTKRVPRWVMGLSRRQLSLFFEAFASGDGDRRPNGAVDFGLANEGLVDDLQEIAAKLGRRATKGYSKARGKYDVWRLNVHARVGGKLQDKPRNLRRVPYRGKIYCIRVQPSHTFLVRYQGRVSWSGNTQFTEKQYTYLFGRLRKPKPPSQWDARLWERLGKSQRMMVEQLSRVPLRMRAGSNPGGPGHEWVKSRFGLYVPDGDPDPRKLCQRPEWVAEHGRVFLPARVRDNPGLNVPEYLKSLSHLDPTTRAQYMNGDWDAKEPGEMFRREWFTIVDQAPPVTQTVRYWDLAATEPSDRNRDPDWTVGLKLGRTTDNRWVILDVQRGRWRSKVVESKVGAMAELDGGATRVGMEQEPGASGKALIAHYQQQILRRFAFRGYAPADSKAIRARPAAAKAEAGLFLLVRGAWNAAFLDEAEAFPPDRDQGHDDQVDALSGAFQMLEAGQWRPV
jgi:predicted phage terminase large subunit-like protein